jgi:hypothetical protein
MQPSLSNTILSSCSRENSASQDLTSDGILTREFLKRKHISNQIEKEKSKRQAVRGPHQTWLTESQKPTVSQFPTTLSPTNSENETVPNHLYSYPNPFLYTGQMFTPTPSFFSSSSTSTPFPIPSSTVSTTTSSNAAVGRGGINVTSQANVGLDCFPGPLNMNTTSFLPSLANLNLLPPSYSTSSSYPSRRAPPLPLFSYTSHTNSKENVNSHINTAVLNNSGSPPKMNQIPPSSGFCGSSQHIRTNNIHNINNTDNHNHNQNNRLNMCCSRAGSSPLYQHLHTPPSLSPSYHPSSSPSSSPSYLSRYSHEIPPSTIHPPQNSHRFVGTSGPYLFPTLQPQQTSIHPTYPSPMSHPIRNMTLNGSHPQGVSTTSGYPFGPIYSPMTTTSSSNVGSLLSPNSHQSFVPQEPLYHNLPSQENYPYPFHRRRFSGFLYGQSHYPGPIQKIKEEEENEDYEDEEDEEEEDDDDNEDEEEYALQSGLFHRHGDSVFDFSRGLSRHSTNRYQHFAPMLFRELTENDYELLLQLDDGLPNKAGALPPQIESLPVLKSNGDDELQCCICLCDVEKDEEIKELACKHRFHAQCIDKWLAVKNSCPIDKLPVSYSKTEDPVL